MIMSLARHDFHTYFDGYVQYWMQINMEQIASYFAESHLAQWSSSTTPFHLVLGLLPHAKSENLLELYPIIVLMMFRITSSSLHKHRTCLPNSLVAPSFLFCFVFGYPRSWICLATLTLHFLTFWGLGLYESLQIPNY